MAVTTSISLKNLTGKIDGLNALRSKKGMELVGQKGKQLNIEQIERGKEATGKSVKPYEADYAAKKGVAQNQVDYVGKKSTYAKGQRRGGHMMAAFGVISRKGSATIGFLSASAKEKAKWNAEHREFIGLTKRNAKALVKWARQRFNV
jgi:hypothetical protein